MSRAVLQTFELYQKARVQFVQTVAELAERPQNIEALLSANVMDLLRPLLLDNVQGIRQSAALALGKLANYSDDLAEAVVSNNILPHLVVSLSEPNRFYKKAAAFVLRAISKHSAQLAKNVVDAGALKPLVSCLEEFDPSVKEYAAAAIRAISKHTSELAQIVVEADTIKSLVLCIQEPEIPLKRVAVSALGEICKHTPDLATSIVEAQAVPFLSSLINHPDAQLLREVFLCLSNIAKHSFELAENVSEADLFPKIYKCLKHQDILVRKYACTCIREISKQSPELAKTITSENGVKYLVEYISEVKGSAGLPGIATIGWISGYEESLAMSVIACQGIPPLKDALLNAQEENIKQTAAWALGQIGFHSNDNARAMAEGDNPAIAILLKAYKSPTSSSELKKDAKKALKNILQMCSHLSALEPLISEAPPEILPYILNQFAKNLQSDNPTKKSFVLSGGLRKILEIKSAPGSKLKQYIDDIINLYPQEIIQFHSPDYKDTLMKKLDDYNAGE